MAKITKISASDTPRETDDAPEASLVREKVTVKDKKSEKEKQKARREKEKKISVSGHGEKAAKEKKPFILFRPFIAFGHYIRDSWRELRQVRWPNRATTWKMVLAVLVYTAVFMVLILLLDTFFTWLSGVTLGT
jgi:preprotein translocase SecE subunit